MQIHHLSLGIVAILLVGCASSTPYTSKTAAPGWRGKTTSELIQHWGTPDQKFINRDGSTVYIYHTKTFRNFPCQASPAVGVNFNSRGQAITTVKPPTNPNFNNLDEQNLTCTAIFAADCRGVVVKTQTYGLGCITNTNIAAVTCAKPAS